MESNTPNQGSVSLHHYRAWKILALAAAVAALVLISLFLSNGNQVASVKLEFSRFQSVLSSYNPELSAAVASAVITKAATTKTTNTVVPDTKESTGNVCHRAYASCMDYCFWGQSGTDAIKACQDGCKASLRACMNDDSSKSITQGQVPTVSIPAAKQTITCKQAKWPNLSTTVYIDNPQNFPTGSFPVYNSADSTTPSAHCTVSAVF